MMEKCLSIGAVYNGAYYQKRYVYDFVPPIKGKWIRLRDNGETSTLAVKMIHDRKISGTKELEIKVSDFETTNCILNELGYIHRNYQENFRVEFCYNDVTLDIDQWPTLCPYMEIEGPSEESVYNVIDLLGFSILDVTTMDVDSIYQQNGIVLEKMEFLRFNEKEKEALDKIIIIGAK